MVLQFPLAILFLFFFFSFSPPQGKTACNICNQSSTHRDVPYTYESVHTYISKYIVPKQQNPEVRRKIVRYTCRDAFPSLVFSFSLFLSFLVWYEIFPFSCIWWSQLYLSVFLVKNKKKKKKKKKKENKTREQMLKKQRSIDYLGSKVWNWFVSSSATSSFLSFFFSFFFYCRLFLIKCFRLGNETVEKNKCGSSIPMFFPREKRNSPEYL